MDYFIKALRKYFDFKGLATRKEYWMFVLFSILFMIPLIGIDAMMKIEILAPIYNLALIIPSISIAARRLHDINRSGWWQLILFIPLIGFLVLMYFLCQRSNADSRYNTNDMTAEIA